jgi:hypothetical protein
MFTRKGFRTPNKKEQVKMAKEQEYKERAEAFLADYKKLPAKHGIDFKATLKPSDSKLEAVLELTDYTAPEEPQVKPWSEAMQENLDTRINCEHKDTDGNGVCGICGLGVVNWGKDGKGAIKEYIDGQYKKIEKSKEREANCEAGKHRLNQEAEDGIEGAMAFCKYCRKPKADMTEEELAQMLDEETDENK